jgi:FHS family L-fucose permease-like MFS transporter
MTRQTITSILQTAASTLLTQQSGKGQLPNDALPVLGIGRLLYFVPLKRITCLKRRCKISLFGYSCLLIIIALVVFRLKLPAIKPQAGSTFSDTGEKKSVLSFRNLNFGIVAIFLYVGAEVSIGTFLPTISVIRYI